MTICLCCAIKRNEKDLYVNCLPMILFIETAIAFMYMIEALLESADELFAIGSTTGHIIAIVFGAVFFVAWILLAYSSKCYAEANMSAEKKRQFEEARRPKPKIVRAPIQANA